MITRREISGIHFYERMTGFHCLLDEIPVPAEEAELCGPRHLSIMLTDRCDRHCDYCYVTKGCTDMSLSLLMDICSAANELQVLDVTLGGGEPTLRPDFTECVTHIWQNFSFGISVTSSGFESYKLLDIAKCVSNLRISLDPTYNTLTPEKLNLLQQLEAHDNVAVNMLYSPGAQAWAKQTLRQLAYVGVGDVLLIPQHDKGHFVLSHKDWVDLADLIRDNPDFGFAITADAHRFIDINVLDTSHPDEYLFAHIDVNGYIKTQSWGLPVGKAISVSDFIEGLRKQHPLRRKNHEIMD